MNHFHQIGKSVCGVCICHSIFCRFNNSSIANELGKVHNNAKKSAKSDIEIWSHGWKQRYRRQLRNVEWYFCAEICIDWKYTQTQTSESVWPLSDGRPFCWDSKKKYQHRNNELIVCMQCVVSHSVGVFLTRSLRMCAYFDFILRPTHRAPLKNARIAYAKDRGNTAVRFADEKQQFLSFFLSLLPFENDIRI